MYLDWTYLVLVLPAVLFSLWASAKVNLTFRKYSKIRANCGMTGADAARMILNANGLQDVGIEPIGGQLTDHYDPKARVVRLSESVYGQSSVAAIGVAAHECGHAVQHATEYLPIKIRSAIIPVTNLGSKLSVPLILLGIVLCAVSEMFLYVAYVGVACFGLCVLFQLVTLPTEFNASRRALRILNDCGRLSSEEIRGSRKVLSAAAMTYVAALAVSLMQLLRLLLIVSGRSNRRD